MSLMMQDGEAIYRAVDVSPKKKPPRIMLVPFDELPLTSRLRYLVKGLIPRIGLVVVWGPPKSGKSFWVFDLCMHVALGREYRGRRVVAGPVVYCAFEGQFGIEARAEAWRQSFLSDAHDPVPFYLELLRLDLVKDHRALIEAIRYRLGTAMPAAIVLDTLNRSMAGSESSDEDMSAYIRAADAVREAFDCAVVVVHHSGLDATRPRGHTSLLGAADAQLSVKRDTADNIVVTTEYMKDGPTGDTILSRLEPMDVGQDEDGDPITSCVVRPVAGNEALPPKTPKRKPLTNSATIALRALEEALAESGQPSPGGLHIPLGLVVVKADVWRRIAYQRGVSGSDEDRARQLAFKRAAEALCSLGYAARWGDFAWKI